MTNLFLWFILEEEMEESHMKEKVINEQIMSAMIDRDLYSKVRQYCFKNNIKVKNFVSNALQEKLNNTAKVSK